MATKPSGTKTGSGSSNVVEVNPPAAKVAKVEPVVVTETKPESSAPPLKKKDLVDRVTARTGLKKRDVKPALEAALEILGQELSGGRQLDLQPLGKIRVNRTKDQSNARIIICKVRQNKAATGEDTLADDAE